MSSVRRTMAVAAVLLAPALLAAAAAGQTGGAVNGAVTSTASQQRAARLQKERDNVALQQGVAPFRMFDNLYYVGVGYVSSWLLTTDQGLVLIDTLDETHADHL